MLVVEIDVIDPEPLQAGIAGLANVVGLAVNTPNVGILGIANDAEFGGKYDFVALAFDGSPDQHFVSMRTVHVGSIEEVDAEFESAVNGGDGFCVVASGVELRHAHTAESLGGNF